MKPSANSRTDIAYDFVCEKLRSGAYSPGDAISVNELVGALKMSRQPIMSALRRLANEDLVQIIPQVGCIAAAYSHDDWHDFHRLFAAGEGLIAEMAAERGTPEETRQLRELENAVKPLASDELSQTERSELHREHNTAFFEHMHRMARSPMIDRQLHAMWARASYHFYAVASGKMDSERLYAAIRGLDAICEAIEHRRAKVAARLVEELIIQQFAASERLLNDAET